MFVDVDLANVREGPGVEFSVLQKLTAGQRLVEFAREGEWVEVGADPAAGGAGWMHVSLLAGQPMEASAPVPEATATSFQRFERVIERVNREIRESTGLDFFTDLRDLGGGTVQITASDPWLNASRREREESLRMLVALWDQARGGGGSITVYVADKNGYRRMVMRR